jgi:hypothetical protein
LSKSIDDSGQLSLVDADLMHIGFRMAAYDTGKPLVIDPVMVYSTYLGGSSDDYGYGIAVDDAGDAYVIGSTLSLDFPTVNALYPNL